MSPYLYKELYQQIKRVINKQIAITDINGQPFDGVSDFAKVKQFFLKAAPSQDKASISLDDFPELQAIPLFYEERPVGLVVVEVSAEDIQTLQIVSSLAELIVQQFMNVHKPRPDAVDLLLTRLAYRPNTIDEEELEQQMAALGFRLDVQRAAIVFELSGFWHNYLQTIGQPLAEKKSLIDAKKHDIEQGLTSFFSKNQDNVIGYIGNDRFLVLKDLSSTDFNRFTKLMTTHFKEITSSVKNVYITDVTIGIGAPSVSASGLLISAQEAQQVLDVGRKLKGAGHVYTSDVLGVLPLVISGNISQKHDQAKRILDGLDDPELTETLEAFLQHNLNLTHTAEALNIHRNTVIYRLDRITEKLGKDPRSFTDAVELYLALQLQKIYM